MLAPLFVPLDSLVLPAGDALTFVDGATGGAVLLGLRCSLVLRRNGQLLSRAAATPSGVHHWPNLAARWRDPMAPVVADVLVQDDEERFLPLSLPWPLPAAAAGQVEVGAVIGDSRLLRVTLLSAPGRRASPGLGSIYGLLVWQPDLQPLAWARVALTDSDSRVQQGATDAQGRLSLHTTLPRPIRAGSPPPPVPQLHVFHDAALATAAQRLSAPDALAFAAQPEVLALANTAGNAPYAPVPLRAGEPLVLSTQGLPPTQRELRLVPL
jgi:hypothetical protein